MRYSFIALGITIICFAYCILYESVLLQYEALNHFLYSLGVVTNCVSLSVIASCIFYFFMDYMPKRHQQKQIDSFLREQFLLLSDLGDKAIIDMLGVGTDNLEHSLEKCSVDLMDQVTNSVQKYNSFQTIDNWFDYFELLTKQEDELICKILVFESNLPIEVKLSIVELTESHSLIRDPACGRRKYVVDSSHRLISSYASEISNHLSTLTNIYYNYINKSKI